MHISRVFSSLEDATSEETTPAPEGVLQKGNSLFLDPQRKALSRKEYDLQAGIFSWKAKEENVTQHPLEPRAGVPYLPVRTIHRR